MKPLQQLLHESINVTDNPNFWKWFGNSNVVDAQGNPLVVYHGTNGREATVYVTDPFKIQGNNGDVFTRLGAHFAVDRAVAEMFARGLYKLGNKSEGTVSEVYLAITNPYIASEETIKSELEDLESRLQDEDRHTVSDQLQDYFKKNLTAIRSLASKIPKNEMELLNAEWKRYREGIDDNPHITLSNAFLSFWETATGSPFSFNAIDSEGISDEDISHEYREHLIDQGYDGIKYENDVEGGFAYIVFEPTQIKSALSNNGDFDPNNPDITK